MAASGNDVIAGGISSDVIASGIGNDTIDGGDGRDTAVFTGRMSDYHIGVDDMKLVVTDAVAGRDGIDRLDNVELLKFADITIGVSVLHSGGLLPAQDFGDAGNPTPNFWQQRRLPRHDGPGLGRDTERDGRYTR